MTTQNNLGNAAMYSHFKDNGFTLKSKAIRRTPLNDYPTAIYLVFSTERRIGTLFQTDEYEMFSPMGFPGYSIPPTASHIPIANIGGNQLVPTSLPTDGDTSSPRTDYRWVLGNDITKYYGLSFTVVFEEGKSKFMPYNPDAPEDGETIVIEMDVGGDFMYVNTTTGRSDMHPRELTKKTIEEVIFARDEQGNFSTNYLSALHNIFASNQDFNEYLWDVTKYELDG